MITQEARELFVRLCESSTTFVLTTHMHPDGDALGSQIGLARFLQAGGKRVRIINQDPSPESLRFLESEQHPVETYDPAAHDETLRGCDLVVLVDNSAPDRLGGMERIMGEVASHTLCIDHHPTRGTPWAHLVLDEDACATAIMIYELLAEAGERPDRHGAQALYVGLATDTGFFRFNSTDASAHEIAADLLRLGADPPQVYRSIYERNSLAYTRLMGHALAGVRLEHGTLASVEITRELIDRVDAADVDPSEITTALLAIDGVQIALMFRELDGERIKVSLRSKGSHDVHSLASEFGGGGHRNASGIVMEGTLDEAVRLVTSRALAIL